MYSKYVKNIDVIKRVIEIYKEEPIFHISILLKDINGYSPFDKAMDLNNIIIIELMLKAMGSST